MKYTNQLLGKQLTLTFLFAFSFGLPVMLAQAQALIQPWRSLPPSSLKPVTLTHFAISPSGERLAAIRTPANVDQLELLVLDIEQMDTVYYHRCGESQEESTCAHQLQEIQGGFQFVQEDRLQFIDTIGLIQSIPLPKAKAKRHQLSAVANPGRWKKGMRVIGNRSMLMYRRTLVDDLRRRFDALSFDQFWRLGPEIMLASCKQRGDIPVEFRLYHLAKPSLEKVFFVPEQIKGVQVLADELLFWDEVGTLFRLDVAPMLEAIKSAAAPSPILIPQIGHTNGISDLAFSANGDYLASAELEGLGIVWDLRSGLHYKPFLKNNVFLEQVVFQGKTNTLFGRGANGRAVAIDIQDESVREFGGSNTIFSKDGKLGAKVHDQHELRVKNLNTYRSILDIKLPEEVLKEVGKSPTIQFLSLDNDYLLLHVYNYRIYLSQAHVLLADLGKKEFVWIKTIPHTVRVGEVSKKHNMVAIGMTNSHVNLLSLKTGETLQTISTGKFVSYRQLNEETNKVEDKKLLYFSDSTFDAPGIVQMSKPSYNRVYQVQFHPEQPELLTGGRFGDILVWDLSNYSLKQQVWHEEPLSDLIRDNRTYAEPFNPIQGLDIHAKNKLMATGSSRGSILIWDLESYTVKKIFNPSKVLGIKQALFLPDHPASFLIGMAFMEIEGGQFRFQRNMQYFDTQAKLVSLEDKINTKLLPLPQQGIKHLNMDPEGDAYLAIDESNNIWKFTFNFEDSRYVGSAGGGFMIESAKIFGNTVAAVCTKKGQKGELRVYNVESREEQYIDLKESSASQLVFLNEHELIFSDDSGLHLWDARRPKNIQDVYQHKDSRYPFYIEELQTDGSYLYFLKNQELNRLHLQTKEQMKIRLPYEADFIQVASPGQILVGGNGEEYMAFANRHWIGVAFLDSLKSCELLSKGWVPGHLTSFSVNPSAKLLLTGTDVGLISVWNTTSGQKTAQGVVDEQGEYLWVEEGGNYFSSEKNPCLAVFRLPGKMSLWGVEQYDVQFK
ncbi:MAG: WD40 repeat domain-containing protein [Bacteroidota bacterium]